HLERHLVATDDDRLADLLDVVEHRDGALVEAEVLDRVLDLAVLDVERAVAREARQQHRLRVDHADVPRAGHEHALLRARDQLRRRLVRAGHDDVARRGRGLHALLLGPVLRVVQRVDLAVLDQVHALARDEVLGVPRQHGHVRVPRVGPDVDLLVEQLVAQARGAALLRQEAAAFVGLARVEAEQHVAEQFGRGGRFQDHGVAARFQRLGVDGAQRLFDRDVGRFARVELVRVGGRALDPAGAAAVFRAHGAGEIEARLLLVAVHAVRVGHAGEL
ncbi:conserved hypothetical protein, partial [Ricinus communis]